MLVPGLNLHLGQLEIMILPEPLTTSVNNSRIRLTFKYRRFEIGQNVEGLWTIGDNPSITHFASCHWPTIAIPLVEGSGRLPTTSNAEALRRALAKRRPQLVLDL